MTNYGITKTVAVVLLVVMLVLGLAAGYALSSQFANKQTTVTSLTTSTIIGSTVQVVRLTSTYTNVTTTYTNTTTVTAAQSLNISQGEKYGSFSTVSCLSPCKTAASETLIFSVPNMTYFYSMISVNASNVSASVSSHANHSVALTLTNANTYPACFVFYLEKSALPATMYVWYYGNGTCP